MPERLNAPPAVRHRFIVETEPAAEALVRVLGAFIVRRAAVDSVTAGAGLARIVVETTGLEAADAEHLRARLAAMPAVRAVGFGWSIDVPGHGAPRPCSLTYVNS